MVVYTVAVEVGREGGFGCCGRRSHQQDAEDTRTGDRDEAPQHGNQAAHAADFEYTARGVATSEEGAPPKEKQAARASTWEKRGGGAALWGGGPPPDRYRRNEVRSPRHKQLYQLSLHGAIIAEPTRVRS